MAIDSYTKLLCPFNTDANDIATAKSGTATGASIDTSVMRFGAGSMSFDGSDDRVTFSNHADFTLGSDPFTIDFWFYPTNTSMGDNAVFTCMGSSSPDTSFSLDWGTAGNLRFLLRDAGVTKANYTGSGLSWTQNTWNHLAIIRNGSDIYMFKNGVSATLNTLTAITSYSLPDYGTNLFIGIRHDLYADLTGKIDEFRLSKGIARWTSNFTPPIKAYEKGSSKVWVI